MNRSILPALTLLYIVVFSSCGKDDTSPPPPTDPGVFKAVMNGKTWEPNLHKATYFPKRKQLFIYASDYEYELNLGISIDPLAALKNYLLEPNGNNAAEIITRGDKFNSDHNVIDAGGSLSLTKFDTTNKLINGNFLFTSYSKDRSEKLVFTSGEITDIPLTIDTASYDESFAICDVNGVKNTSWLAKDFFAKVTCVAQGIGETLQLHISSILGGHPNKRYILLQIPLNLKVGTYQILPDLPPYFYCGNQNITSRYTISNYENSYYATSGTFKITQIDTTLRKLKANFDMVVKDTTSRGESIHISNGSLTLNYWSRMNEP